MRKLIELLIKQVDTLQAINDRQSVESKAIRENLDRQTDDIARLTKEIIETKEMLKAAERRAEEERQRTKEAERRAEEYFAELAALKNGDEYIRLKGLVSDLERQLAEQEASTSGGCTNNEPQRGSA